MTPEPQMSPAATDAATARPAIESPATPSPRLLDTLRAFAVDITTRRPIASEPISPHEPAPHEESEPQGLPTRFDRRLIASAVVGLIGMVLLVASAPVWRYAVPTWRLTVVGVPHPPSAPRTWFLPLHSAGVWFVCSLALVAIGWTGLVGAASRLDRADAARVRASKRAGRRDGAGDLDTGEGHHDVSRPDTGAGGQCGVGGPDDGATPARAPRRWAPWIVAGVIVLWSVPVLASTPLLSNDVYSYAAQGEMTTRGFDPTANGPVVLKRGDFLRAVDPVWRTSPAPYGPVSILTGEGAVRLAGHNPATAVWLLRLVAALGVVLAGAGVVLIARTYNVSPAGALAMAIGNPLVLIYLVGGSHNDALMMGFLLLGVAAARRDKRVIAVVLLSLAVAVKLPAALALVAVGWLWAGKGARLRSRVLSTLAVLAGSVAIIGVLCLLADIGIGWITALKNTGTVMDTFSIMTILGFFATDALHAVGLGKNNPLLLVGPVRTLGVLGGAGIAAWLVTRVEKMGVARVVGLGMLAMIVLGPVVWPWYLPAGFALIAASGVGKYRPSFLVVVISASALVWPTSVPAVEWMKDLQRILSFIVLVLIAIAAIVAQKVSARRSERRLARSMGSTDLSVSAPVLALAEAG